MTIPEEGTDEHRAWAMQCTAERASLYMATGVFVHHYRPEEVAALVSAPATVSVTVSVTVSATATPTTSAAAPEDVVDLPIATVKVILGDTLGVVAQLQGDPESAHGKIGVLDMAARAAPPKQTACGVSQEEDLCRRTTLGEALREAATPTRGLYPLVNTTTVVVQGVRTICGGAPSFTPLGASAVGPAFTVIVAAAPRVVPSIAPSSSTLEQAASGVLAVARDQTIDTLVLGAWGCGGRRHSVHQVAAAFRVAIAAHHHPCPSRIIFAIPGRYVAGVFAHAFQTVAQVVQ